jgi:hypothetical protein
VLKTSGLTVANADVRKGAKKPKYIEKPKHDTDNHDCVQDGLNRRLHGYEAIH